MFLNCQLCLNEDKPFPFVCGATGKVGTYIYSLNYFFNSIYYEGVNLLSLNSEIILVFNKRLNVFT